MSVRIVAGAFAFLCWLAAAAAAADLTDCAGAYQHHGQAESGSIGLTLDGADGSAIGADTIWQPLGGTVTFTLQGGGTAAAGPVVCFRFRGQKYAPSPRVWLDPALATAGAVAYHAVIPPRMAPPPSYLGAARIGIVARAAEMRVIVPGAPPTVLTATIGITSAWLSAALAALATIAAFGFIWAVAAKLNVPGSGLLKVISTRAGVASLSQFQVVLWTFVIGAGAVYVMAISGGLIDVTSGTLVLLGIAGATTAGSKLKNAQDDKERAAAAAASQKKPDMVSPRLSGTATETEISLAWAEPATGGRIRGYRVEYREASAAVPPTPGPWRAVAQLVTMPRYRVVDLQPGTAYEFRVTPRNEWGDGDPSAPPVAAATTARANVAGAPGQAAGLRLKQAAQPDRLLLIWSPVDAATGYTLRRRLHDADDGWQDCGPPTGTEAVIAEGVAHGTRYDFQVAAVNASGLGPWSSVLTARTLRRPRWGDLVIKMDGTDEIDVTRVQMLFFTVVSALFVAVKIATSYTIPDIPEGFLLLMGISNGIYLTAKFIPD